MQREVRYSIRLELRARFLIATKGELLTYEELEEIMGCDPRRSRHLIYRAAEDALKVIECKPKVGYFVVKDNEVRGSSERDYKAGDRKTERGFKKILLVDRSVLTAEEQRATDHTAYKGAMRILVSRRLEKQPQIDENTRISIPSGKELVEIMKGRKEL